MEGGQHQVQEDPEGHRQTDSGLWPQVQTQITCNASPPQVVLVPVVHQAFRANYAGQPGGQEAVVSVDD